MATINTDAELLPQLKRLAKDEDLQIIKTEQHAETGNYRTHYKSKGKIYTIIYGLKNYFLFNFFFMDLNLEATNENILKIQNPEKYIKFSQK